MDEPSAVTLLFYSFAAIAGASFLVSLIVTSAVFSDTDVIKYARRKARREARRQDNQRGAQTNPAYQPDLQIQTAPVPVVTNPQASAAIPSAPPQPNLTFPGNTNSLPPPYQSQSEYLAPIVTIERPAEQRPEQLQSTSIQSQPLPENPIYESITLAREREQQQTDEDLYGPGLPDVSTDGPTLMAHPGPIHEYDDEIDAASCRTKNLITPMDTSKKTRLHDVSTDGPTLMPNSRPIHEYDDEIYATSSRTKILMIPMGTNKRFNDHKSDETTYDVLGKETTFYAPLDKPTRAAIEETNNLHKREPEIQNWTETDAPTPNPIVYGLAQTSGEVNLQQSSSDSVDTKVLTSNNEEKLSATDQNDASEAKITIEKPYPYTADQTNKTGADNETSIPVKENSEVSRNMDVSRQKHLSAMQAETSTTAADFNKTTEKETAQPATDIPISTTSNIIATELTSHSNETKNVSNISQSVVLKVGKDLGNPEENLSTSKDHHGASQSQVNTANTSPKEQPLTTREEQEFNVEMKELNTDILSDFEILLQKAIQNKTEATPEETNDHKERNYSMESDSKNTPENEQREKECGLNPIEKCPISENSVTETAATTKNDIKPPVSTEVSSSQNITCSEFVEASTTNGQEIKEEQLTSTEIPRATPTSENVSPSIEKSIKKSVSDVSHLTHDNSIAKNKQCGKTENNQDKNIEAHNINSTSHEDQQSSTKTEGISMSTKLDSEDLTTKRGESKHTPSDEVSAEHSVIPTSCEDQQSSTKVEGISTLSDLDSEDLTIKSGESKHTPSDDITSEHNITPTSYEDQESPAKVQGISTLSDLDSEDLTKHTPSDDITSEHNINPTSYEDQESPTKVEGISTLSDVDSEDLTKHTPSDDITSEHNINPTSYEDQESPTKVEGISTLSDVDSEDLTKHTPSDDITSEHNINPTSYEDQESPTKVEGISTLSDVDSEDLTKHTPSDEVSAEHNITPTSYEDQESPTKVEGISTLSDVDSEDLTKHTPSDEVSAEHNITPTSYEDQQSPTKVEGISTLSDLDSEDLTIKSGESKHTPSDEITPEHSINLTSHEDQHATKIEGIRMSPYLDLKDFTFKIEAESKHTPSDEISSEHNINPTSYEDQQNPTKIEDISISSCLDLEDLTNKTETESKHTSSDETNPEPEKSDDMMSESSKTVQTLKNNSDWSVCKL